MIIHVDESSFNKEVINSDKPVLVDFWASWCMPCQMMAPVFEQVSNDFPDVKFVKVNVNECPNLSNNYSIDGIPCIILFRNGIEIGRLVGYRSREELKINIEHLLKKK